MGHDRVQDLPVWRLRFADRPGLVVRVTRPTIEAEVIAPRLVSLFTSRVRGDRVLAVAQLAVPFADSLLSWTLQWNGKPVPSTRRGVLRVDLDLMADILREWLALATAAPAQDPVPDAPERADDPLLAGLPMLALVPTADEPATELDPALVAVT
jgi:hypothetical protein